MGAHALIDEHISHVGEFSYKGRFFDELLSLKHIDDVEKSNKLQYYRKYTCPKLV